MASQPDELIGQLVAGRYRVLQRLGQGGMGTVYLAEHEAIEKKVAIKVLRPEYSAKADLVIGCDAIVTKKPFDAKLLAERLRTLIGSRKELV